MPIDLRLLLAGQALPGGRPQSQPGRWPAAVVTSELQRGVMGDLASLPTLAAEVEAADVVANTARLLEGARGAGLPVVHCTVEIRPDRAGTVANTPLHSALLRGPEHLLSGTAATEIVPELGPASSDFVIGRIHGVSPFTGTSLDATLRNLGVQVLVVTGVSVNVAVFGLCVEAVNLGYQVVVATDAVAGVPADYATQVVRNSLSLIATLASVDQVVAALG